jgi:hypothetical protein
MSVRIALPLLLILVLIPGCGEEQPFRKATSPAKGTVTVDGLPPGTGIQIQCHPTGAPDSEHPTVSATETDPAGKFAISTYESGDGLPAGDYTLTFTWQEFNVISRSYAGEDKLNGRYSDPATSTIKLTVKEGEENDMGVIALTTE